MGKYYIRAVIIFVISFTLSCTDTKVIGINNKYKTEYRIYWAAGSSYDYEIYTDSETFICSFQGTNYLLEKGRTEELVSTTAPIRILKQIKYDSNGNIDKTF